RMIDEGAFDLHRPDAVPGDVEHVVDAPQNPVVAVGVPFGAVAREVDPGPAAPVHLPVALVVAPDGTQHAGPRAGDRELTTADLHRFALTVEQLGVDAGEGDRRRARLAGDRSR